MKFTDLDCYPWQGRPPIKLEDNFLATTDGVFKTPDAGSVYVWCNPKFENVFWFTTDAIVDYCKNHDDENFLYMVFVTEDVLYFTRPNYEELEWKSNDSENIIKDIESFNKVRASYVLEQELR